MALSYLGYGENHQKVYGQGGRFQGPLVGMQERLDDPHDKLNLVNKVKDKQVNSKVGLQMNNVIDKKNGFGVKVTTQPTNSSKGTLLKDYTRPEKKSMIGGRDENVNPNLYRTSIKPFAKPGANQQMASTYGIRDQNSSPLRSKKNQEVIGKITGGKSTAQNLTQNAYYQTTSAGAAKNTTHQNKYIPPQVKQKQKEITKQPVKEVVVGLFTEDRKEIWRPNSAVQVYKRYSTRDRDQPESQLRRMQHSQIDLSHNMTPFDVNSKIVYSRQSRKNETLYPDPYQKLQDKVRMSAPKFSNSYYSNSGFRTNPENYRRSPLRMPKAAPLNTINVPEQYLKYPRAKDISDNDKTFYAYNSELYRDHANKVEKMSLRNDGPTEHPIVFNYNQGEYRRSYFKPYAMTPMDRSRVNNSFYSQSPQRRPRHISPWKK